MRVQSASWSALAGRRPRDARAHADVAPGAEAVRPVRRCVTASACTISLQVATDDAFIAARLFTIAPKVPGYLTAVPVTDNEHVVAGQVIARIDDRDYRNAVNEARAQVAAARANIDNIDEQIVVQQAQIRANQAQVDQAQAALVFAQRSAALRTGHVRHWSPARKPSQFHTRSSL